MITLAPRALNTSSIKVKTPDGTLFVHIVEERGQPTEILLNIGKSGYSLSAWANALARVASLALRKGATLSELTQEVSNITSERKTRHQNGITVRSGPEGLATALLLYARRSNFNSDEDDDRGFRPARFRYLE